MSKRKVKARVTSADVNAFIREHAASCPTWERLAERVRDELRYSVTRDATRRRGRELRVTVGGKPRSVPKAELSATHRVKAELVNRFKRRKTGVSVSDLADALDVSPRAIRDALDELRDEGQNITLVDSKVELSRDVPKAEPFKIDARALGGTRHVFGLTADNHLCSKYARMEVLEALYDVWAEQGVQAVYQCGNMIDGEARFNKFDLLVHGIEGQARYFAKHWPKRKGITTYFVTGDDHEGWYSQREGVDIGRYLEGVARNEGRTDLVYLGHMEHDIVFKGRKHDTVMRLIHAGGGSAYATSYAAQKIVESYTGGEKPDVLLIGHYHKAEYGFPRGVHCVQAGTTMDQSPFMRKNKLQAHVGGWTIDMRINEAGAISRFQPEWIPFYDREYYSRTWKYRDLHAAA